MVFSFIWDPWHSKPDARAFLVAWIVGRNSRKKARRTDKKNAGHEGPQSVAAYTDADAKRQDDGFARLKNRYNKIKGLHVWFYDTTIYRGGIE
ncbi:hypothetical protein ABK249_11135 [Neorhizobium sp. Rsf11]|uniref:Transposase n=2 Tax=Neorhizobium TaxID=1525371 RepID=A0ABV0M370_9HYPH|nr:hypothetical protein [Neorhizobium petrolearium]MCC2609318.1 hypothetical protein [Neorhizobium petrolearium]WGI69536.1 hypothetical protein QEO92_05510 [Neorhizobium petrolearium]